MAALTLGARGVRRLVAQLRDATARGLADRAAIGLVALCALDAPRDRRALREAGGAPVVARALDALLAVASARHARCALAALERAWGVHDVGADAAVVAAVLRAMAAHGEDLGVQQGALRLLRLHAAGAARLAHAPGVAEAAARAARRFDTDAPVQRWAATVVALLNSLEPAEVAAAHGASGCARLATASVELAVWAQPRHPPALLVGQRPWHEAVLAVHPRLRERPGRALL